MKTRYIIAVSGGVDSVVLLDKLASVKPPLVEYIVAHVDHGIRPDSASDALFVGELSKKYGYAYEQTELELGPQASEDAAREARYEFLFILMKKYKADAVITAHHQDDVLETMIVNMLRGTGPRGLVGFSRADIIRPFINKTKADLAAYAAEHQLKWRDDSTNSDESYLRNYVRANMMPKLGVEREKLLEIRRNVHENVREVDNLTKKLLVGSILKGELVRARYVVLPVSVQHELLAMWLRMNGLSFDARTIERLTVAMKTGQPGTQVDINAGSYLKILKETIVLYRPSTLAQPNI